MTATQSGRPPIPRGKREKIVRRDQQKCHYCLGRGGAVTGPDDAPWHLDHKTPFSRGGSDDEDNLVLACRTCNLDKRDTPYEEYAAGLNFAERARRMADRWLKGADTSLHVMVWGDGPEVRFLDPRIAPHVDNAGLDDGRRDASLAAADVIADVRSAAQVVESLIDIIGRMEQGSPMTPENAHACAEMRRLMA